MNKSDLQRDIKTANINVWIIDIILFALVISTMAQLADVLGQGEPIWSDWLKAAGFSLTELYFARAVSRAYITKTKAWPLWIILCMVMVLIIPFNLIYSWSKSASVYGRYTDAIISTDIISNYLAGVGSGLISLLIAGMSIVRLIAEKSIGIAEEKLNEYIILLDQRKKNRERQQAYRDRLLDDTHINREIKKFSNGAKRGRKTGYRT